MLTLFSIPKPFEGGFDVIQQNAVESWRRLHPGTQVILFGEGAEAARKLGVDHADVDRNEHGTPLLSDAFKRAERLRRNDLLCFVHADIVLFGSLSSAVEQVRQRGGPFLVVGESWNAPVTAPISFDDRWEERYARIGKRRGPDALDYFVFTPGLYEGMPPFAVGRTTFDNWLVWRARSDGALVVDATKVVRTLHQDHDYGHYRGGLDAIRVGEEARRNRELAAGGRKRLYSRFDATHVLTRRGLRVNLGAPFHWKETSRRAASKLRHTLARS